MCYFITVVTLLRVAPCPVGASWGAGEHLKVPRCKVVGFLLSCRKSWQSQQMGLARCRALQCCRTAARGAACCHRWRHRSSSTGALEEPSPDGRVGIWEREKWSGFAYSLQARDEHPWSEAWLLVFLVRL